MGIRVHKVIGYGIKDLQCKEVEGRHTKKMLDGRVLWRKFKDKMEEAYEMDGEKFLKWMEANDKDLIALDEKEWHSDVLWSRSLDRQLLQQSFERNKHWTISYSVHHDAEYGLAEVLLFVPPSQVKAWSRSDDTIDYIEETAAYRQTKRVVDIGPFGIYPYNAFMTRFRDPEPDTWKVKEHPPKELDGVVWDAQGYPLRLSSHIYSHFTGHWDKNICPQVTGKALDHLNNDWRAQLPEDLLAVLWWFKDCFPDFDAVKNSLRPLLYVYWS